MANYGYMYGAKASDQMHQMVFTDPEEPRETSLYYYNNGRESYIVETSVVEHVAAPPLAEYSYGVKHAQNYGSPVKDHRRARPPEVSTGRGFGGYSTNDKFKDFDDAYEYGRGFGGYPTKDKFKDFDGVNDAYEYGRGFGGYPIKDKFKDFDDVNDSYEYPNSVYNTEVSQPDDAACPPGSAYCPLKRPPVQNHPEKDEQFVPGYQTGASKPTRTAPFNSNSYARPNYSVDDYKTPGYDVYDKDKSGENPVFGKFRDLYLEYRGGKNPNNQSKDDIRRPDRPLTKPTGRAGTARNFPMEGNKLPNVKEYGRYSPPSNPREMANTKSKDDYRKSNDLLGKPEGYAATAMNFPMEAVNKLPNVNPAAAKQPQLTGPVSLPRKNNIRPEMTGNFQAAKEYGRYSPPPNPREMANTRSKDDYRKSNHLLGKPTGYAATAVNFPMEAVNKVPNVNPVAAKQPQLTGPVSSPLENNIRPKMTGSFEAAKQHGKYSPPPSSGEKVSRTSDAGENHKNSRHLLSKPTGKVETAMNDLTEGYNKVSNVPAATKPAHSWGPVSSLEKNNAYPEKTTNLEGAKQHAEYYSTSPSRIIGSKEALEKYDGAFVPHTYN